MGEQNPLFDHTESPSTNPTVEETSTINDGIIFDMATEVSNEPATVETGQVADLSASSPAPITEPTTTANESLVTDITPEISTSPLDSLTPAEPIQMNLPEVKPDPVPSNETVATTDPLDIFGAGIQNTETINNENTQPKQATDDLGFLDAFG